MPEYDDETAGTTDEQSAVATAESDESVEAASTEEAVAEAETRIRELDGLIEPHD